MPVAIDLTHAREVAPRDRDHSFVIGGWIQSLPNQPFSQEN
jgi:hypothetical protein